MRIPVLDFQRHLIRKFSNLNDAHLVLGMDMSLVPTETVHIHRGKIRQLPGTVATTEIPSLGGEVCIGRQQCKPQQRQCDGNVRINHVMSSS